MRIVLITGATDGLTRRRLRELSDEPTSGSLGILGARPDHDPAHAAVAVVQQDGDVLEAPGALAGGAGRGGGVTVLGGSLRTGLLADDPAASTRLDMNGGAHLASQSTARSGPLQAVVVSAAT
jgi:hypothetical protein